MPVYRFTTLQGCGIDFPATGNEEFGSPTSTDYLFRHTHNRSRFGSPSRYIEEGNRVLCRIPTSWEWSSAANSATAVRHNQVSF